MKLSSFEKRVKRRIVGPAHHFFAVCPPGLESICANEMLAFGILKSDLRSTHGGIEFNARLAKAVELNLGLASPSKILMRISEFKAEDFGRLEKKIAAIDWEIYLPKNSSIEFKVTARKSRLYHSDAIAQRCENIILNYLEQNAVFELPESAVSTQRIYIRADHDQFTISLDTTGELLFKRGIKQTVTQAPLRETIAFAMLFWAGFSKNDILVDPMCGSGTFSLEAAMIKTGLPAGFFRSFTFESWPAFSPKAFSYLKNQAVKNMAAISEKQIFASDMEEDAVQAIGQNISPHEFMRMIEVGKKDFFSIKPPVVPPASNGIIMLNPPYGKRMGSQGSTPSFFHDIGKKLQADFKGWRLGIIVPDKTCASALGLNLDFKPVFHGGLEIFAGIGNI